ncbi:DNA primase [Deltaproteobacteria bacterium]|nr:DNA primase [Deltaproteobacteria bacterium]
MDNGRGGRNVTREIREKLSLTDIVQRYVTLRRQGNRLTAPCPFHQETKPSFFVNEEEGFFHCFGCQASGDLFDFYGRVNGLSFRETLEQLAEEAGVKLDDGKGPRKSGEEKEGQSRKLCLKMVEAAALYYAQNLKTPDGEACGKYLAMRGIAPEIITNFGLGWSSSGWRGLADTLRRSGFSLEVAALAGLLASGDSGAPYDRFRGRLMFPIRGLTGHAVAFGGRIIEKNDEAAKYINSADSLIYKKGEHLYGLFQARRTISAKKFAMLTEGYMDVLTLHQYGYTNACGVLGTALTPAQVKRLAGFCSRLELLFDGDGAGRKAALRSAAMILAKGMLCKVVLLPDGQDIDSLLRDSGVEAVENLRKSAPDGLDFCIRALQEGSPREAVEWVRHFLLEVEQPELLPGYISRLARGLGLDEATIRRELPGAAAKGEEMGAGAGERPFSARDEARANPVPTRGMEVELARYLARYPRHFPVLQRHGAELFLNNAFFRELWGQVASFAPEFLADDIFSALSDKHKEFWINARISIPPSRGEKKMTEGGMDEAELREICERLDVMGRDRQGKTCLSAIRQTSSGDEYDVELLKAMTDAIRRKHGQH